MAEMKKSGLYDGASSETWDESKHPRDRDGKFTDGSTEIDLSDEVVPKSVGAKYRNYDIQMPKDRKSVV